MSSRINFLAVFLFIFLIILNIYGTKVLLDKNILLVDERDSYRQIINFTQSFQAVIPGITSVRGYHFFLAIILRLFKTNSFSFLRFLALFFNLLSIPLFWLTARKVDSRQAVIKTFKYSFLPILFPFFPLIYPDLLSTSVVIFSVYLILNRQYNLAGFFFILSLGLKQNNIIWLLFGIGLSYAQESGFRLSLKNIRQHLAKSTMFLLGIALFGLFVIQNKGVALGQREMHPLTISNLGNLYFLLFLFFFLFLPENILQFFKIGGLIKKNKKVLLPIFLLFIIYMLTFTNSHPFNQSPSFLRNRLLVFFTSSPVLKMIFFLHVAYAILSIMTTPLVKNIFLLLYPFTILFLAPLTLIEQRYYLIPLSLFILFKKEKAIPVSYLTVLWQLIGSVLVFWGIIVKGGYFL